MATSMKQENTEFETMTDASTTPFREHTPPTTIEAPDSLWSSRGAIPWAENTFQIIEKQSGRAITLVGDQPKLQSLREASNVDTHWLCVKQDGYFGFQNPQTGRYLGHDGKTGIRTLVSHLKGWELWTPRQHPEGGYELLSPYYSHTLMVLCVDEDGSTLLATAVAFVHSRGFVHGDIHLRNVLVKLPSTFDELSIPDFRKKFGEPETVPISRVDDKPLTTNIPSHAVVPLYLGKKAQEFSLVDAHGLILSDFGEAFSPATEQRLGRDCNTPLAKRAPETLFEPENYLSYPSDIWSLGTAIWEILGMKFIFSKSETQDEIVAQQIDVLGTSNFPESWRKQWERLGEEEKLGSNTTIPRRPTGERETWPNLEDAFEEFVQKYRRKREAAGIFEEQETSAILALMRSMLRFRPEERLTIEKVLESEWMVKWALPQLE
ncbi:hypothetical protein INS49_013349 [Diaporthe citri]|uniref:uncharacterized protein n=1 Tax=Diaporthe citri TaxID=83186 RepID=UPI001C806352|nr:uncharacterized protein INS49_013349 [Diaporthe citri]KAG6357472.1 hypothetical protein INS49_013349 [Diaporthe citri]